MVWNVQRPAHAPVRQEFVSRKDLIVRLGSESRADAAIVFGLVKVDQEGGRGRQTLVWADSVDRLLQGMRLGFQLPRHPKTEILRRQKAELDALWRAKRASLPRPAAGRRLTLAERHEERETRAAVRSQSADIRERIKAEEWAKVPLLAREYQQALAIALATGAVCQLSRERRSDDR